MLHRWHVKLLIRLFVYILLVSVMELVTVHRQSHCFVPGYRSKLKTEGKINLSLFQPPEKNLDIWQKAIPRADRELTRIDCVCELHFHENDIDRHYIMKLQDGSTFQMAKKRPMLKDGAVSSIFHNLLRYLTNIAAKRKAPALRCSVGSKSKRRRISHDLTVRGAVSDETQDDVFTFEDLKKKADKIVKPSFLWGITEHSDFLICAMWNTHYMLEGRIVINREFDIKVFLKDQEIDFNNKRPSCIDDVSSLLANINNFVTPWTG